MEGTPTKQTIQDSFRGASTRRTYETFQKQFEAFCANHKQGTDPVAATTEDCTDFFRHLYTMGRKARTIDCAKTALVAFFKKHNNPTLPKQASQSSTLSVCKSAIDKTMWTTKKRPTH